MHMSKIPPLLSENTEYVLNLPYHLRLAGLMDELGELLSDFDFVEYKIFQSTPQLLIDDYDFVHKPTNLGFRHKQFSLRKIQASLSMSANVISDDKNQLASHLLGRLLSSPEPEIQNFLKQIKTWKRQEWIRPLMSILNEPNGSLLRTIEGHSASINAVVITRCDTRIISASDDNTIKVWDIKTFSLVHTFIGHSKGVRALAIAPNGKFLVSGGLDHTIRVWDLQTGEQLKQLYEPTGIVTDIAITNDSSKCISAAGIAPIPESSDTDRLKVWDLERGTEITSFSGHTGPIDSVIVTHDDQYVISGGGSTIMSPSDETIRIWELNTGIEIDSLTGHNGPIKALAISPDGNLLISSGGCRHNDGFGQTSNNIVIIWDLNQRTQIRIIRNIVGESINAIAISHDGNYLIIGSSEIKIWNLKTDEEVTSLPNQGGAIGLATTYNGQYLIAAIYKSTLKVYDFRILIELFSKHRNDSIKIPYQSYRGHEKCVNVVSVTSDGQSVLTGGDDCTIRMWDVHSGAEHRSFRGHISAIHAIAITPDGRYIVTGSGSHNYKVDTAHYILKDIQNSHAPISKDSDITADQETDNSIRVWEIERGKLCFILQGHTKKVNGLAITPDGAKVISASSDGTLKVWDLVKGNILLTITGHKGAVNAVTVTPNGNYLISAGADHTLKMWHLNSGSLVFTLAGHTDSVNAVVVAPDGDKAISASDDNSIKVWELNLRQNISTFRGHRRGVTSLALMTNRHRFLSAGLDTTVRLWDLYKETELAIIPFDHQGECISDISISPDDTLIFPVIESHRNLDAWKLNKQIELLSSKRHVARINAIAITPNGQLAISASDDSNLKIWNIETQQLCLTLHGHVASINAVIALPDNRRVVSSSQDKTIRIWDIKDGKEILRLDNLVFWLPTIAITTDGRQMVSNGSSKDKSGLLRVWDLECGRLRNTIDVHSKFWIDKILLTPDGSRLIAGLTHHDKLYQWDFETGNKLLPLEGSDDFASILGVTPDGNQLITGSCNNGILSLWDLKTGKEEAQIGNSFDNLFKGTLDITPNSRYLLFTPSCSALESESNTISVWDLKTREIVCKFRSDSAISACAVAMDGVSFVVGDNKGRVSFLKLEGLDQELL